LLQTFHQDLSIVCKMMAAFLFGRTIQYQNVIQG